MIASKFVLSNDFFFPKFFNFISSDPAKTYESSLSISSSSVVIFSFLLFIIELGLIEGGLIFEFEKISVFKLSLSYTLILGISLFKRLLTSCFCPKMFY